MHKFTLEVRQDALGLWHVAAPSLHRDFHLSGSNLAAVLADVAPAWLMLSSHERAAHATAFETPRDRHP
jgi:hypothetical protein